MARPHLVPSALIEFEGLHLGDERRTVRALRIVEALQRDPSLGFPKAVGSIAEREALYRWLRNPWIDMDSLLAPHAVHTVERALALGSRPLIVIDPTDFVFGGEAGRDGLERLGKARHGFGAFFALAVTHDRRPLGVVAIRLVESKGRAGADEWTDAISMADEVARSARPIYVMDREADAFALFAGELARGNDFVVRVAADRWVEDDAGARDWLRDIGRRAPGVLTREVKLARRSSVGKAPGARRKYPPRDGRDAILTVRACEVTLPRPRKLKGQPSSITLNLVQVIEERPPAGETGVEWLIFTTLPIDSPEAVAYIVDAYRARWVIEEYFKALKTGCKYERRELESQHTLLNALGLLAPLAWRLLALRSAADDETRGAESLLEADELHVLRKLSRDVKLGPTPSARDVLLAIAIVGGHFKQNGRPGWQLIWHGMRKVRDLVEGYRLAREEM